MIVLFLFSVFESIWIHTKRRVLKRETTFIPSLSLHEFKMAVLLSTLYKRLGLQGLAHIAMSSVSNNLQDLFNSHLKFPMQAFWKH